MMNRTLARPDCIPTPARGNEKKLNLDGQVYETLPYALGETSHVLGMLDYVFQKCEENLNL